MGGRWEGLSKDLLPATTKIPPLSFLEIQRRASPPSLPPPPTHHPPPSQDESGMNQDKIDVIGDAGVRLRPLS